MTNTLGTALRDEFYKFLEPVTGINVSEDGLIRLVGMVGYGESLGLDPQLQDEFERIANLIDDIANLSDEELESWMGIAKVLKIAADLIKIVKAIDTAISSSVLATQIENLGQDLIEGLFTVYLQTYQPIFFRLASILTIITPAKLAPPEPKVELNGQIIRTAWLRDRLHLNRISDLLQDPATTLKSVYFPNNLLKAEDAHLAAKALFPHLRELIHYLDLEWSDKSIWRGNDIIISTPNSDFNSEYNDDNNDWDLGREAQDPEILDVSPPNLNVYNRNHSPEFSFYSPPVSGPGDSQLKIGLTIAISSEDHPDNYKGYVLSPHGDLEWNSSFNGWDFSLFVEGNLPDFVIGPDGIFSAQNAGARATFTAISPALNTNQIFHLGDPNGTRVDIPGFQFVADLKLSNDSEIILSTESKETELVVQPTDGFLKSTIPGEGLIVPFNLGFGWSNKRGFFFSGSTGLSINLPLHVSLGPIEIHSVTVTLGIDQDGLQKELSASFRVNIGPIQANIERIGLLSDIAFIEDSDGNLGPLDLSFAFKPPNGVGLSVDAGPMKGGGYLFFDVDREEYAGALDLVFSDWISLKAIGMITTKMPDGSNGFSMLIIITAEFGTGIQLGFGFTLNGVGGLLGINRIVSIDPLKDGIRTGAVDSIMFPKNVVENAPRIISDLRKFFPSQNDSFLVGPMAKIGWGTPTLINISIGIVLEIPSVDITILGVIKVILPDEKADVLRLQVNFIGRIEPSNQRLWFYAELFDSRVLFITLEGGMGLLVNWGDNANFVASAGGFHPRYSPPPLPFPEPPRISAMLLNETNAKVRIEGYFAVTSNTVQFGARSELFFGTSDFKIEGHHAYDALFQFDPFFFSFSLSISLSVKVFGVGMFSVAFSGILEGPTPWYIEGKGKISLLFFKLKVPFSHTWGEEEDTKLDPVAIFPLLEKELNALTNWQARLPERSSNLVSLRELGDSQEDQLVLHPVGILRISQRKVPLNFKLDKLGNKRPSDVHKLEVEAALNGSGNMATSKIKEQFAIGQYKDLDDSGRLSSPAFEPLEGGLEVAVEGHQIKTSQAIKRIIRYESIIIDSYYKRFVEPFYNFLTNGLSILHETLHKHFLAGSAVSKSVLSNQHKKRMQPFDEVIEVKPHEYSVAFNIDNKPLNGEATTFTSQAEAKEYMEQKIQNDPKVTDKLHVIPNTEINTAA